VSRPIAAVTNPASLQAARGVVVQEEVVVSNLMGRIAENQIRVCNYRDVKQYVSVVMRKALLSLKEKEAKGMQ
jgi:hypothetical protein